MFKKNGIISRVLWKTCVGDSLPHVKHASWIGPMENMHGGLAPCMVVDGPSAKPCLRLVHTFIMRIVLIFIKQHAWWIGPMHGC